MFAGARRCRLQLLLNSCFSQGAANPAEVPVVSAKGNPGALLGLLRECCRNYSGMELGIPGSVAAAGTTTRG